jgi:hypothetical protein
MVSGRTEREAYYARDELQPRNSAFPLFVLWLIIIVAVVWADRNAILHGTWWRVIAGLFWATAALQTLHCMLKAALAIRTFGFDLVPDTLRTTRLFLLSARARYEAWKMALFGVLVAIALGCVLVYRINAMLPPSAYFCSLLLVILIRNLFPPTAVYLATSTADHLTLLSQLQVRSIPNLAALLALSRTAEVPVSYRFISLFDFRTHDERVWRDVVDRLMAIAPIVILDTRDPSPGVLDEVHLVIRKGYLAKTAFISEPDGRLPVLQTLTIPPNTADLKTFTETGLLRSVRAITWAARKGRPLMDPEN